MLKKGLVRFARCGRGIGELYRPDREGEAPAELFWGTMMSVELSVPARLSVIGTPTLCFAKNGAPARTPGNRGESVRWYRGIGEIVCAL